MKRSRFTEEQILFALKQVAAGQPVADVCRQMGISEATFYVWKKRYGNLRLLEIRELRPLQDDVQWKICPRPGVETSHDEYRWEER